MYYIYFVHEVFGGSSLIKIGVTGYCPYQRLNRLRVTELQKSQKRLELLGVIAIPDDEVSHSQVSKRSLEKQFASLRDHGDWYQPGISLVNYIEEHARPHFCTAYCPEGSPIMEVRIALGKIAGEAIHKALLANTSVVDS
jgi:hypothetical protein